MREFFSRENWLFYLKHPAVRWNVYYILCMTVISLVLAFMFSWVVGLVVLVLAVIGSTVSLRRLRQLVNDTHEYLKRLTYQIKSGQQEALLEMPLGMIMLNARNEIEWINPYMARYFKLEKVVGKNVANVDEQLAKLIDDGRSHKGAQIVTWRDRQFEFLVQTRYRVAYLLGIT